MKDSYRIIGLTGGIGAGKSAASARFSALGAELIDADVLARAALEIDGCCYHEVIEAFGESVRKDDGAIDRGALAGIVFSDAQRRQILNDIVHPRVISDMLERAKRIVLGQPMSVVILDVPLLFECDMDRLVDKSLLIYADEATCVSRITARDNCRVEDALRRIRAQMPQEDKRMRADYLVYNDGPLESLYGQVDALYQLFRSKLY